MFDHRHSLNHVEFTFATMQYHWGLLVVLFANSFTNAFPPESTIDKKGAVASESTICSNIGIELLKRGVRA
jgi:hypothetical protein